MVNDFCSGCRSKRLFSKCIREQYNFDGSCPCSHCLIKSMCDKGCSEFESFAKLVDFRKRCL
jgi:hypothetical protein